MHTYWHCGSGLAAGADVDALVIKDRNELPYIPGKTIKGLIKEAVDELYGIRYDEELNQNDYIATFGYFNSIIKDEEGDTVTEHKKPNVIMKKSSSFFSNAEIEDKVADKIKEGNLQRFMYDSISHTAIETNGIAREHSLRKVQVVVPCTLKGEILNVPESMCAVLEKGMQYTKSLGLNRNRGLGRCTISFEGKEKIK